MVDSFYLLIKGRAKVYLGNRGGREVILSILEPGDYFCEMSMIDDEPSSTNIMSLEDCEFISIDKSEFLQMMQSSPDIAIKLQKSLNRKLRDSYQQIESLALKNVQARVEQVLFDLAKPDGGTMAIPDRITHRDIAAMVGSSREMVTRVFRELETTGVISVIGRRITLVQHANT